jgi:hypothetical protein
VSHPGGHIVVGQRHEPSPTSAPSISTHRDGSLRGNTRLLPSPCDVQMSRRVLRSRRRPDVGNPGPLRLMACSHRQADLPTFDD